MEIGVSGRGVVAGGTSAFVVCGVLTGNCAGVLVYGFFVHGFVVHRLFVYGLFVYRFFVHGLFVDRR